MDPDSLIGSGMKKVTPDFYVDKTKQLGRGNFGIVYKGYHLSANQIIAVKFVQKKMLAKFPDYEREIMVMHDLAKINHSNIMGYYGYEDNEEGLYCFIEFCNGGTLKDLIKSKVSEMKALTLLKQLLDAMTYINQQNKVHRDLKPDNILLDQNGQLKIADFGLARDVEAKMTKGVCTPLYAAPQVLNLDPEYGQKCDVWSAGLILYELLTGKEMFEHVKKRTDLLKEVGKFSNVNYRVDIPKQLHPQWKQIIAKMLTHNANKRPAFKQLKQYFKTIEPDMRNDLIAKYGEEAPGLEAFQNQLRLTKSISPYQSNPIKNNKGGLTDMAQKLKQQKSFTSINNLRKWLNFARQKAQIMIKLIKQFNNTQFACVKNVNKYILMFLSVSCYISRMISYSNEINKKKISTPQGIISQQDIISTHMNEYKQMLKQTLTKLQTSISKYKGVLQKQIILKIMGTYMKRPQQQKIITDCGNLLQLLNKAKQGNYVNQDIYMNMFKKVANSQGIHFSTNVVKQFKYQDIKVYTYIRVIACLDQAFLNTHFKNDDYLRSKKQQIQNATKEELLQIMLKYNSAN